MMNSTTTGEEPRFPEKLLGRWVVLRPGEASQVLRAGLWSALILGAYYVLRPLREEIGSEHRQYLATLWKLTFVGVLCALPLHGVLLSRFPRRVFVPACQRFFALNLVLFWFLLRFLPAEGRAPVELVFYVWLSVFNLFAVTVFWSVLADLFTSEAGGRLFGVIAAGGTLGAILGSALTSFVSELTVPMNFLLAGALLLEIGAWQARRLTRSMVEPRTSNVSEESNVATSGRGERGDVEGDVLSGLKTVVSSPYLMMVCAYLCFFTLAGTFAYFEQAEIVRDAFTDRAERTAFFARLNLAVNLATALLQGLATAHVIRRLGVGVALAVLPLMAMLGFLALGLAPILPVLAAFQVIRRTANFALAKPARELLFTVVGRQAKYRSKAFIDTVIYRGGDVVWSSAFDLLSKTLALGLSAIAFLAVPLMALWVLLAVLLGRKHQAVGSESGRVNSSKDP